MTKFNSEVGIILPTYNSAKSLEKAIDSVLAQTYKNFELVIIDNFSDDNTESLVKKYKDKRIKYFLFRNDGVVARSRNYGMSLLKCKYVALLDSDDSWEPSKLEESVLLLDNGDDVVYHKMRIIYSSEKKGAFLRKHLNSNQLNSPVINGLLSGFSVVPNSSVMIRTSIIERKPMYRENREMLACEDLELLLYLSQFTEKFKYINKTLGNYFLGENNLSNRDMSIPFTFVFNSYKNTLDAKTKILVENFIDYQKGRYLLGLSDFDNSKFYLMRVIKSGNTRLFKSSVFWFCRLHLFQFYSRFKKIKY